MKSELKTITPEWAQFVLDTSNTDNRKLRRHWVNILADAINRGEWQITHQGIAFDKNGILLDGQHRLSAIVKSGKSVSLYVMTGLQPEAFKAIDAHAKRTMSDLTKLPKKTAEVCKAAAHFAYSGTASPDQVKRIADAGLSDIHNELIAFCGAATAVFSSAPIRLMACALILDDKTKRDHVMYSYRRLCTHDFVNMTPYEATFAKRVASGIERYAGGSSSPRLLAIAYKVFDANSQNLVKLYVTDTDIKVAIQFIKNMISGVLK